MQSIKEHNLKANHNCCSLVSCFIFSVCNLSKNTIWKQITTSINFYCGNSFLYAIYQRTQSESKSQQPEIAQINIGSVCNLSKNTIWKQITTSFGDSILVVRLYAIYQRTQSESKSQLNCCDSSRGNLCMQSIKEHNLKANHNSRAIVYKIRYSVCNLSKNTIWKQITTICMLCKINCICMQSIKEHNLKANHNKRTTWNQNNCSVCNLSKNTIWKQITTLNCNILQVQHLYAIYQRTQSESKSQHCVNCLSISCSVCNLSKNTIWKQITTANH